MGRRIDPDIIDADQPPPRPIRPDQGYRVGARISAGDAGRTKLAGGIAAGIVVAGLVFASISPLLPDVAELPVAPAPSRVVATALPDFVVLNPPAPTRFVPVSAGGLRWLDPAGGDMTGDAYTGPRGATFIDWEGRAICICVEVPWSAEGVISRVVLQRYSAAGEEIARTPLFELQAVRRRLVGSPVQVDAAISPDGATVWISHAARVEDGWQVGLERLNVASGVVEASLALPPLPAPGSDDDPEARPDGWVLNARSGLTTGLRVSPDGSTLAVLLGAASNMGSSAGAAPVYQRARLNVGADLDPASVETVVPAHDATAETCDTELSAWATNQHFVTICGRAQGAGVQPFVRIENPDDITRDVAMGPPAGTNDTEWLLDADAGVLYRWSTLAHVFTRLNVHDRTMGTLALEPEDVGSGDLGIWPASKDRATPWAPLTRPDVFRIAPRITGSQDGTLIFALGYRSVADQIRDDRLASTGIWVFNAATVELVARWEPAALYDQIGYAPVFESLVTLASAGSDGAGGPADWEASLRFHDARTGEIIELIGDVQEASGFIPALLAPNAPGGIAGF